MEIEDGLSPVSRPRWQPRQMMGDRMRLMAMVLIGLVCLLVQGSVLCERSDRADGAGTAQGTSLYVCARTGIEGKLVEFDPQTGAKVRDLTGVVEPVDVAIGPNDDFFVTDEGPGASNVRRFNHETGEADADPYGQTSSYLLGPKGLAFGPDNHLYVADWTVEAMVVEFDENGDFVRNLPDDPATPVLLLIEDVACDSSGTIYVTQWDDGWICETPGVYKFTGTGWTLFGQTNNLFNPYGLCFGPDGDLYVAEDGSSLSPPEPSAVYRYNGATGALKSVFGQTGSNDNLVAPRYLTFSPDGDLYVTDAMDESVRKFSGPLKADAGTFKASFGQATAGNAPGPYGLVFGSAGAPPEKPELLVERLEDGNMLLTLTGTQGKSYDLRYSPDPAADFTGWSAGGIISLEGAATGTWKDDTASQSPKRFYKALEQ